jgi:hypothetical protein
MMRRKQKLTPRLPAVQRDEEVRALEFAKEKFRHLAEVKAMTPEAGRAAVMNLMDRMFMGDPIKRLDLIAKARAGDDLARELLKYAIVKEVSLRNLPADLDQYAREFIYTDGNRRPHKRREHFPNNALRDLYIVAVLSMIIYDFGVLVEPSSIDRKSACEIVSTALVEAHTNIILSARGVKRLWETYGTSASRLRP